MFTTKTAFWAMTRAPTRGAFRQPGNTWHNMRYFITLLGVGVVVYFVVKAAKEQASKSKLATIGTDLSGRTVVNPTTGQTQGWTPYGPQAGNI